MAAGPWDNYSGLDTSYQGVEQGVTQDDLNAARRTAGQRGVDTLQAEAQLPVGGGQVQGELKPIGPKPKPVSGPWDNFAQQAPPDQQAGPWSQYQAPQQTQPEAPGPWTNFTSQPANAPQQPYFSGDPTADIVNKAHSIANGIVDDPVGFLASIGTNTVGIAGMMQEAVSQINPMRHVGANATPVDPESILKAIMAKGQQATNALLPPENQSAGVQAGTDLAVAPWALTGGYVAGKLEEAGYPQMAALVNLAGVYSMFKGFGPEKPKASAESKAKPKLSEDQQTTLNEALKAAQDEAKAKTGAPMLEDQSALEAASKVAPDELGRVEPTLKEEPVTEGSKTAPEPMETKEATETPPASKETLPEPPGTVPVPDGMVRMYQQFHDEATAKAIETDGIKAGAGDKGANTGDPVAIYASKKPFYGDAAGKYMAEFRVRPEEIGRSGQTILKDHIPPEDIIAVHRPWQETARAIEKDPALIRKAVGGFLDLGKEDKPAIDYIKEKYSDENYGPNKISPLGGPGKKQGGAIQIFSVTDKPQKAADYETAKAVVGRMDMTVEEYAKLHPELPTKDTRHRIGLQTGSYRTGNELLSNYQNKSHAIWPLAYMNDTMHLLTEKLERFITTEVYPHKEAILKFYRASTLAEFSTMYRTLQKNVVTQLWFERNPGEWFDGRNYNPTKEQLMRKGVSEKGAEALLHDYAAGEAVWPHLVEFAKTKGIDVPTRIPGWVPSFTQGAWQVRIFRDTPEGPKFFGTIGARSRWEANSKETSAKALIDPSNPDHAGLQTRVDEPKPGADMASMITGLFEAQGRLNNAGLTKLMQTLYEQSSIGSLKQSLERQATPQILHQLDRIKTAPEFQLGMEQARQALLKKMQIYEAIPAMNMRAHYVRDYLIPMEAKGYFNADVTPNAVTALHEFNKQFLHISDRSSAHIDGYFTDQMVQFGINPQLPVQAMRFIVGTAAKYYLYGNVRFYAQTMLQKSLFLGANLSAKSQLLVLGIKDVSVAKAMLLDTTTTSRSTALTTGESLHAYTEHTGHATPTFVENLDTSRFARDPIAMGVERYTRQGGMRLGYNMFKQVEGWSEKDALNAAGRFTDAMNGPYDRQHGRPVAFDKEGQMLGFTTLFMQWSMHFLQFMSNQSRTLMNAYRAGEGKAFAYAAGGLATTVGMALAIGGLGGMVGSQTYNWLAQWFNTNFGTYWPTTANMARGIKESMLKHNFGDEYSNFVAKWAEFGGVSVATGYDFSGSLQGPSVTLPEALPHFLSVLIGGSVMAGRWLTKEGVSTKDLGSLIPDMPGPLRGAIAEYLRGDTFKDLMDKVQGKKDDYAPSSHDINLQGTYKRKPEDTLIALLNLRAIGESAANTTIRLHNAESAADSLNCARLFQNAKESPNSPKMHDWLAEMTQLAMRGTCDPLKVKAAIVQYAKEKEMPGLMREMYAVTKAGQASAPGYKGSGLPEDKLKWERLQQMRALEPK